MYLVKTPKWIQDFFPGYIWSIPGKEKCIFLTFDDGPIPEVTPWVLKTLKMYDARASFFCVGDNVRKHPLIYQSVQDAGHAIGNHTFNHLNGWASSAADYLQNVRKCAGVVNSNLFRPPYGKIKPKQAAELQKNYRIIMWDTLSGDFDPKISADKCLKNVIDTARSGSIIVFHDSLKAFEKLKFVLPKVLAHFTEKGYRFEALHLHDME